MNYKEVWYKFYTLVTHSLIRNSGKLSHIFSSATFNSVTVFVLGFECSYIIASYVAL